MVGEENADQGQWRREGASQSLSGRCEDAKRKSRSHKWIQEKKHLRFVR
jgi:hypothetical protein